VDDNLLSLGRRNAAERVATLLLVLYKRAAALLDPLPPHGIPFPLSQQLIADAMGLSLAHTHRTLRLLERAGLHQIRDGRLQILNPKALERLADVWADGRPAIRPLL
jgi:CRP-like cAMP-binding protein